MAAEWNKRWQAVRKGDAPALVNLDRYHATKRRPRDAILRALSARHFRSISAQPEWAARPYLTREKIWWPAWFRIRDMWGDVAPDTITFEMMSKWRAALEKKHGRGVAHKTLRVWRTFWKIMLGMKVARTADRRWGSAIAPATPRGNVGRKAKPFASSKPLGGTATGVWRALSLWLGTPNSRA